MKNKKKEIQIKNLEIKIKEKTVDYKEDLHDWLQDQQAQIAYLNEVLKEDDIKLFLIALKDVVEARCGSLGVISKKSKLNRQNLYKILSLEGNPRISTISKLLGSIGVGIGVYNKSDSIDCDTFSRHHN